MDILQKTPKPSNRFGLSLAGRLTTNPNTKIYVGVGWVKLKANLDLHKNTWYNTTVFLTKGEVKYGIDTQSLYGYISNY